MAARSRTIVVLLTSSLAMVMFFTACSATNKLPGWMNLASAKHGEAIAVAWQTSYDQAKAEAADSGKLVMLWFTGSDWCKYCTMLEQEVFHTARFNEWYGDKLVPVMLDYPKQSSLPPDLHQQNAALKQRYASQVTKYPTALFVNAEGQVIGKLGYVKGGPDNWIRQAESILSVTW